MIFLTLCFLQAIGIKWEWLPQATYHRAAFMIFWSFANGPFAFSVLLLRNALVLHDLPNMASTFIHLTPSSLAWCMRWYSPLVDKQWNGIFNLPAPDDFS